MRLTRPILMSSLCLVLAAAGLSTLPGSAAAAGSSDSPSLTAKVTFGRSSYVSGQTVTATLTVRNTGSDDARNVKIQPDYGDGDLGVAGHGLDSALTIPAGKSVSVNVTGHPINVSAKTVTFSGELYDRDGDGVAGFASSVPVKVQEVKVTGEVFADANSNGRADRGEGLRGAKVDFSYQYGQNDFRTTAGADGKFQLEVPAASYYSDGGTSRWTIMDRLHTVGPRHSSLALRAVRPLADKALKAEVRFTKKSYAPGDTVHTDVTLTNTTSHVLRGIVAYCGGAGDPNDLAATSAWGSLHYNHGVTLKPHRPTVFHVTNRVPKKAQRLGSVVLACNFGYAGVYVGYTAHAETSAKVPGESGAVDGTVTYSDNGSSGPATGLKNVRVVLVDPATCPIRTRKTSTDSEGAFGIAHAPAGSNYRLYLFPPKGWKVVGGNPTSVEVIGQDTVHLDLTVARGTGRTPKVPTKCS